MIRNIDDSKKNVPLPVIAGIILSILLFLILNSIELELPESERGMKKIDGVIAKCDFNFNRKSSGVHLDVYFHKAKNKRLQMSISKFTYSRESLNALDSICQKGEYAYADYVAKRMVYDPKNIRYVIHTFRIGDLTFAKY